MFSKLTSQIKALDEKKKYLDADWEDEGNHSLLDYYVKIMPKLTDAERCTIFIHDPIEPSLWLKAGTGVEEKEIELDSDDDSIVGNVIASGKPTIIHGLNETEGLHKITDPQTGFVTKSVMCIPIKSLDGKEIAGAVQLLNKKEDGTFTDEDLESALEMAHYLQWSLENIYYHAEATDILQTIYRLLSNIVIAAAAMLFLVSPILMLWGFPLLVRIFSGN